MRFFLAKFQAETHFRRLCDRVDYGRAPLQAFVPAAKLLPGEKLLAIDGATLQVTAVTPRATPSAVYNLEIQGEHAYAVSDAGVVVHNSGYGKAANAADDVGDAALDPYMKRLSDWAKSPANPANAKSVASTGRVARRPGGYRVGDTDAHEMLSPGANRAPGHANLPSDGRVQSHHGIQREWAKRRNIKDYDEDAAPGKLLKSSSGEVHAKLSAAQRARRRQSGGWDTDIRTEFNLSYREMINSGMSPKEAKQVIKQNYKYFDSIGAFE